MLENRFTTGGSISKFHRASDKGVQHLLGPGLRDLFKDFPSMGGPAIVERPYDTDVQLWIGLASHFADDFLELLERSQGQVLALQGDDHHMSGDEGVGGEHA